MLHATVIGSASQDIFLKQPTHELVHHYLAQEPMILIPEGTKIFVEQLHYGVGGSAINVTCALHRLGYTVTPYCTIGKDAAGDYLIHALQQKGITTDQIERTAEHKTGISCVIPSASGDTSLFVYRGANSYLSITPPALEAHTIKQTMLYCGPLSGEAAHTTTRLFNAHTRANYEYIAHNPSIYQLTTGYVSFMQSISTIDLLILNTREARTYLESMLYQTNCAPRQHSIEYHQAVPPLISYFAPHGTIIDVCSSLHGAGVAIVAITDGPRGVYISDSTALYYHPAPDVTVRNSVGAGDAFGATLAGGLATKTIPLHDAIIRAILNSGAVLSGIDATSNLYTADEMALSFKSGRPSALQIYRYDSLCQNRVA